MSIKDKLSDAVAQLTAGNRHGRPVCRAATFARLAGMERDEAVDFICDNAPPPRPDRRQVEDAYDFISTDTDEREGVPLGGNGDGRPRKHVRHAPTKEEIEKRSEDRRRGLHAKARGFVADLRERGHGTEAADVIMEFIRMDDAAYARMTPWTSQASRQLRLHFPKGDKVWAGTLIDSRKCAVLHRPAKSPLFVPSADIFNGICDASRLADLIDEGKIPDLPTHVSLNPTSGTIGHTKSSTSSFDCKETVGAYRYALLEFDALKDGDGKPSQEQADIVAGLIDFAEATGAMVVPYATFTAGKSIHLPLRIPLRPSESSLTDLDFYKAKCALWRDLFASSDDDRLRVDVSGWSDGVNGITHIRLGGGFRPDTGRRQRLIYANPNLSAIARRQVV